MIKKGRKMGKSKSTGTQWRAGKTEARKKGGQCEGRVKMKDQTDSREGGEQLRRGEEECRFKGHITAGIRGRAV